MRWLKVAAVVGALVVAPGALAGSRGASAGEAWDDAHMRSRYRPVAATGERPGTVEGSNRYDRITNDPAQTPSSQPTELRAAWSQRGWEPGGPKVRSTSSSIFGPQRRGGSSGLSGGTRTSSGGGGGSIGLGGPRGSLGRIR